MDNVKLTFLNTIWSDAILLSVNNHFALIDTGADYYLDDLINLLKKRNITHLDFIFLTHFHSDHYGNLMSIVDNFKVDTVYFREYSKCEHGCEDLARLLPYLKEQGNLSDAMVSSLKEKLNLVIIDENLKEIKLDNLLLHVYGGRDLIIDEYNDESSPFYHIYKFDENFASVALYFENNNHHVYLAADLNDLDFGSERMKYLNQRIVKDIYEKFDIKRIDFYKMAHHGHQYNNNPVLLKLINPKMVLITNTTKFLKRWKTIKWLRKVNPFTKIYKSDYYIHEFDFTKRFIIHKKIKDVSSFIKLRKD